MCIYKANQITADILFIISYFWDFLHLIPILKVDASQILRVGHAYFYICNKIKKTSKFLRFKKSQYIEYTSTREPYCKKTQITILVYKYISKDEHGLNWISKYASKFVQCKNVLMPFKCNINKTTRSFHVFP